MLAHEQQLWARGVRRLAGVDEAGRGPLAGPVVAAAAVFDPVFLRAEEHGLLRGLTDSKQLSAARRAAFHDLLQRLATHGASGAAVLWLGIGLAEADEIDAVNILRATHRAMARALAQIAPPAEHALVDGLPVRGLPCPHTALVKGDALSLSIAAASVIAKVTRDRLMLELDRQYPAYGFAAHKGYGTAVHLAALRRHGASPIHRRSFAPVRDEFFATENSSASAARMGTDVPA